MKPRHFLDIDSLDRDVLRHIINTAHAMKAGREEAHSVYIKRHHNVLVMVFEKPSTRTRLSFDVAMHQLGGKTISINSSDMQIGRGETIADTARVLSRYGNLIMLRTTDHAKLLEFADHATVPVINGLTNLSHPCQIMADIMTFEEYKGAIEGRRIAWIGDGNNVAVSWVHAAAQFGFSLKIASPEEFEPKPEILEWVKQERAHVILTRDPREAVKDADCVVTDVWVSMGDKDAARRSKLLAPYQVDKNLMAEAADDAIFMHCLPARREYEVTSDVLDGPQSVVFDEAENRLHVQKAILAWCLELI